MDSRLAPEDFDKWYVRNRGGEMIPFSAFATGEWTYGSPKLERYNGIPSVEILGEPAPGYSTGQAMVALEKIMEQLPPRSEEHTSELQSRGHLVCRLLLEKKNKTSVGTKQRT